MDNIKHHFSSGVYAKECIIPKGSIVVQHQHSYDHLSVVASGRVLVTAGDTLQEYVAPACINIPANTYHAVKALEDSVWFCIHHTYETDPEKVDKVLIKGE